MNECHKYPAKVLSSSASSLVLSSDGRAPEDLSGEWRVDLLVEEEELARRRAELVLPVLPKRGWRRLYGERVMQANYGADLDFMRDDS